MLAGMDVDAETAKLIAAARTSRAARSVRLERGWSWHRAR